VKLTKTSGSSERPGPCRTDKTTKPYPSMPALLGREHVSRLKTWGGDANIEKTIESNFDLSNEATISKRK